MNPKAVSALVSIVVLAAYAPAKDIQTDVDAAYQRIKRLQDMKPDTLYRLPVGKAVVAGPKEEFLRKRTAKQILDSNLSSGCGDYAVSFMYLMQKSGYRTLFVDGAQVSTSSLISTFSGHAVVAVKDPKSGKWWLANPTDRSILSRNWSMNSKNFEAFGRLFWIGYCGKLDEYPAKDGESLRLFYARTLRKIPKDVLNQRLTRLAFTIDQDLRNADGNLLNPKVDNLEKEQAKLFADYGVSPEKKIEVLVQKGSENDETSVEQEGRRWIVNVGLKSSCSSGLLAYLYAHIEETR